MRDVRCVVVGFRKDGKMTTMIVRCAVCAVVGLRKDGEMRTMTDNIP